MNKISVGQAARAVALAMAVYHLWTSIFGLPMNMIHRPVHAAFALLLLFLAYGKTGRREEKTRLGVLEIGGIIAVFVMIVLYILKRNYIMTFIWYTQPIHLWTALLTILVIGLALIAAKRMVGTIFMGIVVAFLLYAFLGPYLPGILEHRGVALNKFIDTMALIPEGIFGAPLQVSSTYIFNFILFGAFLKASKAGDFFIDLAMALAGRSRGGPAKVAIFSSAAVGTISGSVVANVLTTGVFTIPMMERIGYKKNYAAAVEATASTGGMLMPPIMGATAFIVAELSGTPYITLCKYALIPAVLYFVSLVFMIDLEAAKLGMKGLPKDRLPKVLDVLKKGWYKLLPLVCIIVMLLQGYSPLLSGVAAIAVTIAVSWLDKENRMGLKKIADAMIDGAISSVQVAGACMCAGIVVGVVAQTGLGYRMGSIIISLSGGILPVALFLCMICALILGMGLTVTPAYIILAALITPVLITMGLLPVQAHLFAFYYCCLCAITPPVAIGAFAAAGVADAPNMQTGLTAMKIAAAAYIIPYMFAFGPGLLMIGSWQTILLNVASALLGIFALAVAAEGYFLTRAAWYARFVFGAAAISLIDPSILTDVIGIGLVLLGAGIQYFTKKHCRGAAQTADIAAENMDAAEAAGIADEAEKGEKKNVQQI